MTYTQNLYCKEDFSLIENYELAKKDDFKGWSIHHRDEIRTLPSGMTVIRTREELIENGRYYNCPANELIFLTKAEHQRLHAKNRTLETLKSMAETLKGKGGLYGSNNPFYGKHHTEETKQKISKANKGRKLSEEFKELQSKLKKGKPLSTTNRLNIAAAQAEIGVKYRAYKSNGGTMTYNEFRASIKKSR